MNDLENAALEPTLVSIEACRNQNIKNPQNFSYEVSHLWGRAKIQILF
jgi:hypothetical protein